MPRSTIPVRPSSPRASGGGNLERAPAFPVPARPSRKRTVVRVGRWVWQTVKATAYGVTRNLKVICYQVVWPKVLGLRPILVVLVRDPLGKFKDAYLFTTDLSADAVWVIEAFSRRWSIEVAFKASKQVMGIQSPQHWCQESIEKLSPWVWLMQSVIGLWYFTDGRKSPQARAALPAFGRVGHRMVAPSHAPRAPRRHPGTNNYPHVAQ